jgi:hypothetical protein
MNKEKLKEILEYVKVEQDTGVKAEPHYIFIRILEALLED